jgi:hypothetical protein
VTDVYKNVVRISQGKKAFGTRRRRWEDNIKNELKDIRRENVDSIHPEHERIH